MTSKVLRWLLSQPLPGSLSQVARLERTLYDSVEAAPADALLKSFTHVEKLWATLSLIDALAIEFGGSAIATDSKSFEGQSRVLSGSVSLEEFWGRWYPRLKKHRAELWETILRAETFAQAA